MKSGSVSALKILICIRKPEHLGAHNWAKGTVKEVTYSGGFAIYHIKLANGRVVKSQVPAPYWYVRNITPPTWGETVYISWPEEPTLASVQLI